MNFVAVEYHGVTPIGPEMFPCVLLRWAQRDRVLPLWVAATAADELDIRDNGMPPRRPNAYDLLAESYAGRGGVTEIRIVSHHQGVFYANIMLDGGEEVDARASDAIVLARIIGAPIVVAEDVLTEASLFVAPADLASYFDVVIDSPAVGEQVPGDEQADADFEELMRSLGVSEDDLRGES
ncbi:bifunctional nuclease family protein [Corynebacterium hindlerae]|uniref:Bifunctional nuclease family protein n=1 Tax=Corynebacterium hindlerae TaxID=699041 RepID=A0A7G5FF60_9CORY|nr:bifunctional nuclease family protein [Corynebacterium hindlerae]QMV85251.1 bifunctional nuclease family protein [Corynebacterium hindlerae]